jgi:hypothetical protein
VPTPTRLDPITFEVVRNGLGAAAEEMALALRRSAYSTNIKTRSDFSCAFFDRQLRVAAQAFTQPVHLGLMVQLVPRAVRVYGTERLQPGDMLITNDRACGMACPRNVGRYFLLIISDVRLAIGSVCDIPVDDDSGRYKVASKRVTMLLLPYGRVGLDLLGEGG